MAYLRSRLGLIHHSIRQQQTGLPHLLAMGAVTARLARIAASERFPPHLRPLRRIHSVNTAVTVRRLGAPLFAEVASSMAATRPAD
jgi:hypothetical protein